MVELAHEIVEDHNLCDVRVLTWGCGTFCASGASDEYLGTLDDGTPTFKGLPLVRVLRCTNEGCCQLLGVGCDATTCGWSRAR